MNRIWSIIVGVFIATSLVSCTPVNKALINPSPIIGGVEAGIQNDAKNLGQTTVTIKDNAAKGQEATPDAVKPILQPFWVNILVAAGIQDSIVKDLQLQAINAEKAKKAADQIVSDNMNLQ